MAQKVFFTGLAIALFGWSIAWFLENGVLGASIFGLGFLIGIVGLVAAFVKGDVTNAPKTQYRLRLRKSTTANIIGLSGVAMATTSAFINDDSTRENAATFLFYLGFGLIGFAICMYLFSFYKGKQ